MAEEIIITGENKSELYKNLHSQLRSLIEGEGNLIANLSNIMSVLKYSMNYLWVGLYKVDGEELVLNVFQGPVACTRIPFGKGVCGSCWKENMAIVVPNVDLFPGHIACSSLSKSEIVLPIRNNSGEVIYVLDIDSEELNAFDEEDLYGLEKIAEIIESLV